MSSEREHPAQGQFFSRPVGEDETSQFPASGPLRGEAGLFDPDTPVRTLGSTRSTSAEVAPNRSAFGGAAVLGSGPEISLNRGSSPHSGAPPARTPYVPVPAPATLSTPAFERVLDWSYRWRTLLGLGLAVVTTAAVLVAYQIPGGDNLATDAGGPGAESRSALAAATEFSATQPATSSTTESGERQVNSAVDDDASNGEAESDSDPAAPNATTSTTPLATTTVTVTDEASSTTTSEPAIETSTTLESESTTSTSTDTTETTIDPSSTTTSEQPGSTSTTGPTTTEPTTTTTPDSTTTTVGTTPPTVRVEAETGTLLGAARARSDHDGFSGSGFIGDIISEGSGVSLAVDAVGGATPFTFRYSASPENGPPGQRTLSVLVNGQRVTEAQMRLTASWDDWDVVVGSLDLVAGPNIITLVWEPGDTGWVSIDYIEIN